MMNAIGGYFELAERGDGIFPHRNGILLNSGRNALEYILRSIPDIKCIWLPYYTCDAVLQPLQKLKIPYYFYHINLRFEIDDDICLKSGEYIIINNYFGIKDAYIREQFERYGERMIADCSQAFFAEPLTGMKAFYSCRKFVGVADGGIAYGVDDKLLSGLIVDDSSDRISHLYIRKEFGAEAGFKAYQDNEQKLNNQDIRIMSVFTKDVLSNIDYDYVIQCRKANYSFFDRHLSFRNKMILPQMESFVCPMVYPLYELKADAFRLKFFSNRIYVAKYWPKGIDDGENATEVSLQSNLLPIPVDQRVGQDELSRIMSVLNAN